MSGLARGSTRSPRAEVQSTPSLVLSPSKDERSRSWFDPLTTSGGPINTLARPEPVEGRAVSLVVRPAHHERRSNQHPRSSGARRRTSGLARGSTRSPRAEVQSTLSLVLSPSKDARSRSPFHPLTK